MLKNFMHFAPSLYAVPNVAPPNVRVTGVTASSVSIAWDPVPCLNQNSEIVGYRSHVGFSSTGRVLATGISDTGTSYTRTGLTAGTSYFFQVYSVTSTNIQGRIAERFYATTSSEYKHES